MEFVFKNGIQGFSQRLHEVIDQLDDTDLGLLQVLLDIAVNPDQEITFKVIEERLAVTPKELDHILMRLEHFGLITWQAEPARATK
ncbi:hypothetical protein [Levilactobacillus huananensis]|uniref:hypothetical protein n=1 Tax=Levilactobacillus huananensis TaxID=2486019 RepID=UPI000F7A1015|nr:hypothetical protein [Levilactobacillus huananensis]